MHSRSRATAYLALAAVCFFWGTTYAGIRMALESFAPATLVCVRFLISGGILLAVAKLRGTALPRGRELRRAALFGVLILGVGNGSLAYTETYIGSGLASLFITLSPFWMVGLESLIPGGEPLHWPAILGMIVGFTGTALLLLPGSNASIFGRSAFIGLAISQLGVIFWSLGSIFQKRQTLQAHPVVIGAVQQVAAGLAFLPLAILFSGHAIVWTARGIFALWYLVIFGSIVGYSAYIFAMDRLPVSLVSIYPYTNAVVAVFLGWLVFKERVGLLEVGGMAIIFLGVGIVKRQTRH